jgi:VanZ family protein
MVLQSRGGGHFYRDGTGDLAQLCGTSMLLSKFTIRRQTLWPFVLAGTITWCSGYPAAVPEMGWFEPDKLGHFAAYGALATAIVRLPKLGRWPVLGFWWALPLASVYGLGDEFRQSLTYIRTYDLADWVADSVGAAVAVSLYLHWPWYRRLMETPLFKKCDKAKSAGPEIDLGPKGAEVTQTESV